MIYIDPPYNTGSDLIYNDDFQELIRSMLEIVVSMMNKETD